MTDAEERTLARPDAGRVLSYAGKVPVGARGDGGGSDAGSMPSADGASQPACAPSSPLFLPVRTPAPRENSACPYFPTRMREAVLEALSPTRCAGCERPGDLVCERCLRGLDLIDPARSCLRCGAPLGDLVCTECDAGSEEAPGPGRRPGAPAGRGPFAFERCLAMASFSGPLPRIVRAYKDGGERRLAPVLADLLLDCLLHAEREAPGRYGGIAGVADALAFVPATAAAYTRRGFDHMELVARPLAEGCGLALLDALAKHGDADQRTLGRAGRRAAGRGAYEVVAPVRGLSILLVDDVMTTGATLDAAASALLDAGARRVDALVLARVCGG